MSNILGHQAIYEYEGITFYLDEVEVSVYHTAEDRLLDTFNAVPDCTNVLTVEDFEWQCRDWESEHRT